MGVAAADTDSRETGCGCHVLLSSHNTVRVVISCAVGADHIVRVYGLVSWPLKTDKHGELVRKYCKCDLVVLYVLWACAWTPVLPHRDVCGFHPCLAMCLCSSAVTTLIQRAVAHGHVRATSRYVRYPRVALVLERAVALHAAYPVSRQPPPPSLPMFSQVPSPLRARAAQVY